MSKINIRYRCQNLGGLHLTTPAMVYGPESIQFCIYNHTTEYLRVKWHILQFGDGSFKVGYTPVITPGHEEAPNIDVQASSPGIIRVDEVFNGYRTLIAASKWQ